MTARLKRWGCLDGYSAIARKEILKAIKSFHDFQIANAAALVKPDVEPFHNGIT